MNRPLIRDLGIRDYLSVWNDMKGFTDQRSIDSQDEFWLLEHHAVYTQGQAGKSEHLVNLNDIPIVQTDRGGQITYHGPGQIIIYTLCNLKRIGLGVRGFVSAIEDAIINLLAEFEVEAHARRDAPGVYVGQSKIAALGLRVRKGFTYHGVALNVDMDLSPYKNINPCGYVGMQVTKTRDHGILVPQQELAEHLVRTLTHSIYQTSYTEYNNGTS